jgi:CHAT domain-containing protein
LYRPLSGPNLIHSNYIQCVPERRNPLKWAIFLFSVAISLFCLSLPSDAQETKATRAKPAISADKTDEKNTVEPGVVVEEVEAGREGDKAGLKVGDVILGWARGDANGKIESPFDYLWVEIEQRPRGPIELSGLQDKKAKSWHLEKGEWGLTIRPNFIGRLLQIYKKSWAMVVADKPVAGAKFWEQNHEQLPPVSWMPAWSQFYIAQLFRWGLDGKSSNRAYSQAVKLAHNLNSVAESRILNSWGGLFCNRGANENAEKHFRESVDTLEPDGKDTLLEAYYLSDLGGALAGESKWDEAVAVLLRALDIRTQLGPGTLEIADSLVKLGDLELQRDNHEASHEYYERALSLQNALGASDSDKASALFGLARIALERGNLIEAQSGYTTALSAWSKIGPGNSAAVAAALNGLGGVAFMRDDIPGAQSYYRRALRLYKDLSDEVSTVNFAVTLCNLGEAAAKTGNADVAVSYYRLCLPVVAKYSPNDLNYASFLNAYAEVLIEKRKFSASEASLRIALQVEDHHEYATLSRAETLDDLAQIAYNRQDYKAAIFFYQEALEILQITAPGSTEEAESLAGMAASLRANKEIGAAEGVYALAMKALERQAERLGSSSGPLATYRARHSQLYRSYIDLLMERGKPDDAVNVLELSRARTLLETLSAATVDIRQGANPELLKREHALRAEIKAKSDRRVEMLTHQHNPEQMKPIESEIADLSRQYDEVEENLRSTSPNYAALTRPKPLSTKEIQKQLLDKDTVLVEYSLGEKRSYAFVVTPDLLTAHELPGRVKIEQAARRLHRLLKNEHSASAQASATTTANNPGLAQELQLQTRQTAALLSRMVLNPIAGEIGNKRLLIVADGALHYIPFTALPEPLLHSAAEARSSQPAPPLIMNHEVILLPSASVLAVIRKQQERKSAPTAELAVLADPVFDKADTRVQESRLASRRNPENLKVAAASSIAASMKTTTGPVESARSMHDLATPPLTRSLVDVGLGRGAGYHLPRLRYTRREAEAIYAEVPRGRAMKALDFDANRATATSPELSRYRIVHFATHGLLNSEHPELSGLVLSLVDRDGRPQDGFLGLQDIYNLNLPADLVVLSACETGLGKEISGEGLIGLTRGFMYAGASRVVASLWKVSDAGTARLMAEFYRAMERDHLAPAAALRQAQIFMWKQKRWNDPYYWAAFQIQGEWK